MDHRGVAVGCREGRDLRIQTVPAVQREFRRFQAGLVGGLQGRIIEPLPVQPGAVGGGPDMTSGVDQTVTQQELRDPVSGPPQVNADVLAGTHQIPGGFIRLTRNPHRRYLSKQRQPSQLLGITGIGLHPAPGRALEFGGRRNEALDPCIGQ
jgi:hypothetical protein